MLYRVKMNQYIEIYCVVDRRNCQCVVDHKKHVFY